MPINGLLLILASIPIAAQELDLGTQDAALVVSPESTLPYALDTIILFSIFVILGLSLLAFFFFRKQKAWIPLVPLENFPGSAKVAITLTLISYALVHLFALLEVYLVTKVTFKTVSEYFFYMTLPKLMATSHAHFFGHGTMYLITSAFFIFSKVSEFWKVIFVTLALSAGLLDVASWWAIKYGGEKYEIFSALAGIMSVVGWGSMTARIIYELWWSETRRKKI